jgi:hypothetical protein
MRHQRSLLANCCWYLFTAGNCCARSKHSKARDTHLHTTLKVQCIWNCHFSYGKFTYDHLIWLSLHFRVLCFVLEKYPIRKSYSINTDGWFYETPIYTPPLRRLVCLIRSSQISDVLFGGLLNQITKHLNIVQQYIKRIKNIMVYIKRIRKCPQKDVLNNPLFSRCCVCVIAVNS